MKHERTRRLNVPSTSVRRKHLWVQVLAVASFIAAYLFDDALIAWPIPLLGRAIGFGPALLLLAPVYGTVSYGLAIWAVRAYERSLQGEESRLARWLGRQSHSRRSRVFERLLFSVMTLGFVVSSFALGAIITTFLIRYAGRRSGIHLVAAASSAIFGLTFVGFYSGIFGLAF